MSLIDQIKQIRPRKIRRIVPDVKADPSGSSGGIFEQEVIRGEDMEREKVHVDSPVETKTVGTGTVSGATSSSVSQRDPGKRQRIFVVAGLTVLLIFGLKVWGRHNWEVEEVVLVALLASVLSTIGLIWAFRFDISRVGYLTVLPQPAMFVFGYVLFVEIFFFQSFQRIYEAVIFGVLLLVFMAVLGVVFLTANVLNVSTFRKIPLLQVAQTSSYAITLFNVFFLSFFVINLELHVGVTVILLFLISWIATFLHLSHFSFEKRTVMWFTTAIATSATIIAGVLMLWPLDALFRVLLPTVIVYIGIGLVMHDVRKVMRPLVNWEYILIVLAVILVLLSRAVWGIGGFIWS